MPRVRRFSGLDRKAIIDCITPLVAERHRVDLEDPDYTIIVEICEVNEGIESILCLTLINIRTCV